MSKKKVKIEGTGVYFPKAITSEDLESRHRLPKGWSKRYSGVQNRHHVTNESNGFMGARAAEDAANKVGQLTSYNYAEFGSAQTIDLDQYVDLSDNNNNTITFRIKPLNGTGSGKHMLKFSGGSTPFGVEVRFTTTGTNWQTITANFGSGFRNYRNLIIFPDFQSFKTDVYLIDDIQGATNIAPRPKPTEDAPIPSIPAERVKGIYGETYTNIEYKYNFSESFKEIDIEKKGNKALEIDLGYYGAGFKNTDASEETYVHFNYWTNDATKFALRINSENPSTNDKQYKLGVGGNEQIIKNTWTSVYIPLSYFSSTISPSMVTKRTLRILLTVSPYFRQ